MIGQTGLSGFSLHNIPFNCTCVQETARNRPKENSCMPKIVWKTGTSPQVNQWISLHYRCISHTKYTCTHTCTRLCTLHYNYIYLWLQEFYLIKHTPALCTLMAKLNKTFAYFLISDTLGNQMFERLANNQFYFGMPKKWANYSTLSCNCHWLN